MSQQSELFEHDPAVHQLLDHIDNIPVAELEHHWPQMLVALVDVMEAELKRLNVGADSRMLARKLALAMSHYMGGRQYYLPSGDKLVNALRDDMIYSRFNGRNLETLRREHRLSQTQIYDIIARQRKLHTRRHQPDLFSH
ncbi:positive regulator of late transcription [Citrobacter freundii]|uniref:Mor transcription activator family protein n=1 Tax=Enterobacteriaceae TaxID=543 RepID=UPI000EBBD90D|nr:MULTISPECIES: Mor transcription activator family protein [Enterobacteriaceae]ELO0986305.1 positive regulator of late transcription [Citrobacter freundii]ELO1021724.1 positive regulator of late transcription [Citrobacter freundii]MDL4164307.1 Mor transcription activator family protein [Salmonella enterica]MDL4172964.1 Mor transcription activator family protein [Salmonella enterica]MDL4203107.1 Mor transcription activator family protein [Salmonella enterica]